MESTMRRQVAYVGELLDEAADLVYTVFDALLTAAAPDTMKQLTEARTAASQCMQRAYASYAKASELVGVRPSPAAFAAVAAVSGRLLLHLLRARLTLFRALKLTLLAVLLSSSSSAPSSSSPSLPPPSSPLSSSSLPPSLSSLLLTQSPPIAAALGSLVSSYWTLGSEVLHLAASLLPLLPAALPASFAPRLTALLTRLRSTP